MSYEQCVYYTVLTSVLTLDRPSLKAKVCLRVVVCVLARVRAFGAPDGLDRWQGHIPGDEGCILAKCLTHCRELMAWCSQVIKSPEVLAVVDGIPHLRDFMTALYDCDYARFFRVR